MLRLSQIKRALAFKRAFGIPFDEGACFGVTDSSRLRPAARVPPELMPALGEGSSRRVVMVDDGQGNMIPDEELPEEK